MADTRPLSERLADIMRLPIPGGSADTLAEAVELARRVERAPTSRVTEAHVGGRVGKVSDFVPQDLIGKRVALVEVPGG